MNGSDMVINQVQHSLSASTVTALLIWLQINHFFMVWSMEAYPFKSFPLLKLNQCCGLRIFFQNIKVGGGKKNKNKNY